MVYKYPAVIKKQTKFQGVHREHDGSLYDWVVIDETETEHYIKKGWSHSPKEAKSEDVLKQSSISSLKHGYSAKTIEENIKRQIAAGKTKEQATIVAMKIADIARKRADRYKK